LLFVRLLPMLLSAPRSDSRAQATSVSIKRLGLCSNWLERKCEAFLSGSIMMAPTTVPLFLRPTKDFLAPGALEAPLVMIGPGTGVAPFLGFLEHRCPLHFVSLIALISADLPLFLRAL
jgi:ferredoxin-NADP reductase